MRQIFPPRIYEELPCSVVAVGCALGIADSEGLKALVSPDIHSDGYLSLKGMNALVRANLPVQRFKKFKRGDRPMLWEYILPSHRPAIVCVEGHFIYTDGSDYWSFFQNANDRVVAAWELDEAKT